MPAKGEGFSNAGKKVKASNHVRAWNRTVELMILKHKKDTTNYEAVQEALELCEELLDNIPEDE